jgi:hypothetical protein
VVLFSSLDGVTFNVLELVVHISTSSTSLIIIKEKPNDGTLMAKCFINLLFDYYQRETK